MSCCGCSLALILGWIAFICVLKKIYCLLTMGWCKSNTCLTGKTALITGGNAGLGFQTALALAGRGAKVIIADISDMEESKQKIIQLTGNDNIHTKHLDLSSLASVRKFSEEIRNTEDRLDILVNNAGVGGADDIQTQDGLQLQMAVNYFGPFLLTHLLVDLLKKSAPSRIIFVSSNVAFFNNVTADTMNQIPQYNNVILKIFSVYGNSKVCMIIASNYFAEKLKQFGVTSNALYPGIVYTDIYKVLDKHDIPIYRYIVNMYLKLYGKSPLEGAQTQINLALSEELKNTTGQYFMDCKRFFQPRKTGDKKLCKEIIRKSEEYVKLQEQEKLQ